MTERNIAMMIDTETLGLRPDSVVLQIGICVADLDEGKMLVHPYALHGDPHEQADRHIDISTVHWWMQQDRGVAEGVFKAGTRAEYARSAEWIFNHIKILIACKNITSVWAGPAMFDLPLLTDLWRHRKPWHFTAERCFRTLRTTLDPRGELAPPASEQQHDAAADAQWQMEYLMRLWQANGLKAPRYMEDQRTW